MNQRLAALRFITSCLSDERPETTKGLHAQICAGTLSWELVVGLSNNHLLTPALWVALNRRGLTEDLPDDLGQYLRDLHSLNAQRNNKLRAQLLETVTRLNAANIVPALLKGAMHLVSDVYPDSGVRVMSDIDLLVAREDIDRCLTALQELGYRAEPDSARDYPDDHHHCAPLFRQGDYGSVEIHRELTEGGAAILPAKVAIADAEPLMFNGLSMKVLSPTHRALHNILHSQITDRNYASGRIPLRSLHEVATESAASSDRMDWSALHTLLRHRNGKVLRTYLYLAHRLFSMPLPPAVPIRSDCQIFYLRCFAQFMWDWADTWGVRIARFSVDSICRKYACKDDWLTVNLARLRESQRRLANRMSRTRNIQGNSD
jgi:hypothetical protein